VNAASAVSALHAQERTQLGALLGERARFDEPLAPYTSWKIGGPADVLVMLETERELEAVLRLAFRRKLPWFVLGSGSNLLIGDGGMRGIVIRLGGEFARASTSRAKTLRSSFGRAPRLPCRSWSRRARPPAPPVSTRSPAFPGAWAASCA
jgi:hypothetical protein